MEAIINGLIDAMIGHQKFFTLPNKVVIDLGDAKNIDIQCDEALRVKAEEYFGHIQRLELI